MIRPTLLVVDDEPAILDMLGRFAAEQGFDVVRCNGGQAALDYLDHHTADMALIDVRMPDINGLEVLRVMRDVAPACAVALMTGYAAVDTAVKAIKLGAIDFLSKPFEPEKLLDSVRRGMSLSGLRKEKAAAQEQAKQAQKTEPPATQDKNDLVLRGLGVLGEAYSLGLEKRELLEELSYLESEAKYHAGSLGQIKRKERAILDIRHDLLEADAIMEKYDFQKSALIQVLLDVQQKFNWLPRHILHWVAARLNVSAREVYTIAGFYEAFSLEPRGRHCVQVCTGTACHVRGASEVLSRMEAMLNLKPGQTDSRQQFTLDTVHCLGCCALAPVVQIDDKYHHDPSRKKLEKIVESFERQEGIPCRD